MKTVVGEFPSVEENLMGGSSFLKSWTVANRLRDALSGCPMDVVVAKLIDRVRDRQSVN